jgi:hypothetical protein
MISNEVSGRFYTATDLRELADQGAKQANEEANGYSLSVGQLEENIKFTITSTWLGGVADLFIEVEVSHVGRGGKATRSLRVYDPSGALLRKEALEPIRLGTDGNPTASVTKGRLHKSELIRELIRPVVEAAQN